MQSEPAAALATGFRATGDELQASSAFFLLQIWRVVKLGYLGKQWLCASRNGPQAVRQCPESHTKDFMLMFAAEATRTGLTA